MQNILIPLLISSIAGFSTMLGSIVILFKLKEEKYNKFITLSLSFSMAIMIGISIFDLIPESLFKCIYTYGFIQKRG